MTLPVRIQRRRTPGWRMPVAAVYVGRPSVWGNPFIGRPYSAVAAYRAWLLGAGPPCADGFAEVRLAGYWCPEWAAPATLLHTARQHLRGKDLACWCPPDRPCHADVLLDLANGEPPA